jgi:hypothetical protein
MHIPSLFMTFSEIFLEPVVLTRWMLQVLLASGLCGQGLSELMKWMAAAAATAAAAAVAASRKQR